MRVLLTALIAASLAVVPLAAAQTAGPSVPVATPAPAPARLASTGAALDGKSGVETPKAKQAHHAGKKRVARHAPKKAHVAKRTTKPKPAEMCVSLTTNSCHAAPPVAPA